MTLNPTDAPAGIIVKLLPRPTGAVWADWVKTNPAPRTVWQARRLIRPRLLLVHTNGADGEGSAASAFNWSMAAPTNTKPHYQVDRNGQGTKFLPSDREGIANYKASMFSTAIETADEGWGTGKPGGASGFTPAQAETIARIIAWEAEEWSYQIEFPTSWDGTGVAAHTEPFGYPFWTNSKGKPCPGPQKKLELKTIVMPRARELRRGAPAAPVEQPKPVESKPTAPIVITPPAHHQEDNDDMANIGIIIPPDAQAQFIGLYVGSIDGPRFLDIDWINSDAMVQLRNEHIAAGATVFGNDPAAGITATPGAAKLMKAHVRNCIVDILPVGDGLTTWSSPRDIKLRAS